MIITLLGHSGCGKSHLAERMAAESGFRNICCDDLIEQKLGNELSNLGLSSIHGVSQWIGQPYEAHSEERQSKYLECEKEVMNEVISGLGEDGWNLTENVVIDTSGSVIYTGARILEALKARSRIIYFAVPESDYPFMFRQYLSDPKPVIWAGHFSKLELETDLEAVARCYPQLIRSRSETYAKFADVTFVMKRENRNKFSMRRLLQLAGVR